MKQKIHSFLLLATLLFFLGNAALAIGKNQEPVSNAAVALTKEELIEQKLNNIGIVSAKAKPSLAGSNNSAAYVTLYNGNEEDLVIIGAMGKTSAKASASSIANRVEMHIIVTDDKGVSRMVPVNRLVVPAKSNLIMKPGGVHIMLLDLKKPLNYGDKFYVHFIIEKVGMYSVEVSVG
jgi:periplasmic copper chaperone A